MRKLELFLVFIFSLFAFSVSGCGPTYPKEHVDSSIIDLCKKEYDVDVEVKIAGKTLGVYIPLGGLINENLAVDSHAIGKVDDVIMSVSRVALSTDADFNFYVVVAQDPLIPELELVIIRYVKDVKRFLVTDISRSEYFNRMITEIKLTPQVQKEKLVRGLFENVGFEISDKVVEEYFQLGYIDTIADIGYWNGRFFLKDLSMGEFIAKQIEGRIRKIFSTKDLLRALRLSFIQGNYQDGAFGLNIKIDLEADLFSDPSYYRALSLEEIYKVFSRVIYGYKFKDYSHIKLFYGAEEVVFTKDEMDDLRKHKIKLEDII